jgi:hypothetical protein
MKIKTKKMITQKKIIVRQMIARLQESKNNTRESFQKLHDIKNCALTHY